MEAYARKTAGVNLDKIETVLALGIIIGVVALVAKLVVGDRGLDFAYMNSVYLSFLEAMVVTLYVTTLSFFLGMGIGFVIGWVRTARTVKFSRLRRDYRAAVLAGSGSRILLALQFIVILVWAGVKYAIRRAADAYVEIMRGTPLFVQIMFTWSVMLVFYARMPNLTFLAGLVAMTINTGGYQGEIFRGGLQTVHSGQVEAARAIGFSRWGAMRNVILPQALRLIIPPLTNEYIGLLKASSLLFVLGIHELTYVAKQETFSGRVFEAFALTTIIYLAATFTLSKVVRVLEDRYRIPGLGVQAQRSVRVRVAAGRAT